MNELPIERIHEAIREVHGCESVFTGAQVRVTEKLDCATVWHGVVLVFDLAEHPSASRCYAWSADDRVTAVLHDGPVDSPRAAVRAAMSAEHGGKS